MTNPLLSLISKTVSGRLTIAGLRDVLYSAIPTFSDVLFSLKTGSVDFLSCLTPCSPLDVLFPVPDSVYSCLSIAGSIYSS